VAACPTRSTLIPPKAEQHATPIGSLGSNSGRVLEPEVELTPCRGARRKKVCAAGRRRYDSGRPTIENRATTHATHLWTSPAVLAAGRLRHGGPPGGRTGAGLRYAAVFGTQLRLLVTVRASKSSSSSPCFFFCGDAPLTHPSLQFSGRRDGRTKHGPTYRGWLVEQFVCRQQELCRQHSRRRVTTEEAAAA